MVYRRGQTCTQLAKCEEGEPLPCNLSRMLHELGNKLIQTHGFTATVLEGCSNHVNRTTEPLVRFLVWLHNTPEASSVLRDLGAWQEDIVEAAELELNTAEQLPRSVAGSNPGKRRTSVA
jgi:hypothetical protein